MDALGGLIECALAQPRTGHGARIAHCSRAPVTPNERGPPSQWSDPVRRPTRRRSCSQDWGRDLARDEERAHEPPAPVPIRAGPATTAASWIRRRPRCDRILPVTVIAADGPVDSARVLIIRSTNQWERHTGAGGAGSTPTVPARVTGPLKASPPGGLSAGLDRPSRERLTIEALSERGATRRGRGEPG